MKYLTHLPVFRTRMLSSATRERSLLRRPREECCKGLSLLCNLAVGEGLLPVSTVLQVSSSTEAILVAMFGPRLAFGRDIETVRPNSPCHVDSVGCCLLITLPFHSREWSISNFTYSLTRNMTSHSMKNLAFHSLLRWKMFILPILTTSLIRVCTFWSWELKDTFFKNQQSVESLRSCTNEDIMHPFFWLCLCSGFCRVESLFVGEQVPSQQEREEARPDVLEVRGVTGHDQYLLR